MARLLQGPAREPDRSDPGEGPQARGKRRAAREAGGPRHGPAFGVERSRRGRGRGHRAGCGHHAHGAAQDTLPDGRAPGAEGARRRAGIYGHTARAAAAQARCARSVQRTLCDPAARRAVLSRIFSALRARKGRAQRRPGAELRAEPLPRRQYVSLPPAPTFHRPNLCRFAPACSQPFAAGLPRGP